MRDKEWKIAVRGKPLEVRKQVDRVLKTVIAAKDFILSVASMDPVYAGLPWAGVCLLLPLLVNDSKQRTAAIDGLETITQIIHRYAGVEEIYLGGGDGVLKHDLRETIVKLYKGILEYEARAVCQFQRRTVLHLARNIVTTDDWNGIIDTMKSVDKACEQLMNVLDSQSQQTYAHRLEKTLEQQDQKIERLLAEMASSREGMAVQLEVEEMFQCHRIFRTSDYEGHKARNPDRVPGTCHWLLDNSKYRDWRDQDGSSLLWVSGDPGYGNSVLSKYLVDEAFPPASHSTCYFFFKDDDPEQRDSKHAICALLHQLFAYKPHLLKYVQSAVRENGKKVQQLPHTLWTILLAAATDPNAGTVICILDALDECEESTRYALITGLKDFYLEQAKIPNSSPNLKFLVTSRPYQDIELRFNSLIRHLPTIHLAGEDESESIRHEINLVIKAEVRNIGSSLSLDIQMQGYLQEKLLSITHRTYLWLKLVLAEVESVFAVTRKQLDSAIDRLPESVDAAYTAILDRSRDVQQAKRLLHIILAAKRPLTVEETNVAFNMTDKCKSYEDLDLESTSSFQKGIRNLCGLFVSIIDSRVYLIHQTAKEFLVSNDSMVQAGFREVPSIGPWKYVFLEEESNLILGRICMRLLDFAFFENEPPYIARIVEETPYDLKREVHSWIGDIEFHLFLEYAASQWAAHIRQVKALISADLGLALDICDPNRKSFFTWYTVALMRPFAGFWPPLDPRQTFNLHVASRIHLPSLVKPMLELGAEVNAIDKVGETALHAAIYRFASEIEEMLEIVILLAKSGASLDTMNMTGSTALHIETFRGYTRCVEILVQNRASVHEIETSSDNTALHWAACSESDSTVILLLKNGASVHAKNYNALTALHEAVRNKQTQKVIILLDAGSDIDAKNNKGQTALKLAARSWDKGGHCVRTLLQSKPDIEAKDNLGETPLHGAVVIGSVANVRLLLDAGADVHATGRRRERPLHYAARYGSKQRNKTRYKIEMLLRAGLDIEAKNEGGLTAIQVGIKYGHHDAVRSLVDAGADIESNGYADYLNSKDYADFARRQLSSPRT